MKPIGEREFWLDRSENVSKLYRGLWLLCALLLVAELMVHKHGELEFENWFGFHGWFGFVACVLLVLAAKLLRVLIKRPEDYYERD